MYEMSKEDHINKILTQIEKKLYNLISVKFDNTEFSIPHAFYTLRTVIIHNNHEQHYACVIKIYYFILNFT